MNLLGEMLMKLIMYEFKNNKFEVYNGILCSFPDCKRDNMLL